MPVVSGCGDERWGGVGLSPRRSAPPPCPPLHPVPDARMEDSKFAGELWKRGYGVSGAVPNMRCVGWGEEWRGAWLLLSANEAIVCRVPRSRQTERLVPPTSIVVTSTPDHRYFDIGLLAYKTHVSADVVARVPGGEVRWTGDGSRNWNRILTATSQC